MSCSSPQFFLRKKQVAAVAKGGGIDDCTPYMPFPGMLDSVHAMFPSIPPAGFVRHAAR
jgi:hypothetical protein